MILLLLRGSSFGCSDQCTSDGGCAARLRLPVSRPRSSCLYPSIHVVVLRLSARTIHIFMASIIVPCSLWRMARVSVDPSSKMRFSVPLPDKPRDSDAESFGVRSDCHSHTWTCDSHDQLAFVYTALLVF